MAFEKITENVENISLLPNTPAMTPTELKAEFDKGNKTIKTKFNKLVDDLNSENFLKGTTLYENNSGTNETISLDQNPLSYKRIEIDYLTDDGSHTVHYRKENIPIYQETTQVHDLTSYYFGSSYMYTYDAFISINTDSIVFNTNRTYQENVNTPSSLSRNENSPIKITKIVGYNY